MTERLERSSAADLEIRSDGRTVAGIAVPYGEAAEIRSAQGTYRETFQHGAFARTISERGPERVKFLALHGRDRLPLGRATLLREDAAGLYGEFRVSKTNDGDQVLELIRDGALDALSIGFRPMRDEWSTDNRSVTRVEAALHEVSVVAFPAYENALVAGVRHDELRIPMDDATAILRRFAGPAPLTRSEAL
jgi:HK97 family phage prohead protease